MVSTQGLPAQSYSAPMSLSGGLAPHGGPRTLHDGWVPGHVPGYGGDHLPHGGHFGSGAPPTSAPQPVIVGRSAPSAYDVPCPDTAVTLGPGYAGTAVGAIGSPLGAHRCGLPMHLPYYPSLHGYYYFHPYHPSHIAEHQAFVAQFGVDPRNPYSNDFFQAIYAEYRASQYERIEEVIRIPPVHR